MNISQIKTSNNSIYDVCDSNRTQMINNLYNIYNSLYYSIDFDALYLKLEDKKNYVPPKGDQGTQGIQGETGHKGNQGPQGVMGDQGSVGPIGDTGDKGLKGQIGLRGDIGDQGSIGPTGYKGLKGNQGSQGSQGAQGATGDLGSQGTPGKQGTKGKQGTHGIIGAQGKQGSQGSQGLEGKIGDTGDKGDMGDRGKIGNTGSQGSQGLVMSTTTGYSGGTMYHSVRFLQNYENVWHNNVNNVNLVYRNFANKNYIDQDPSNELYNTYRHINTTSYGSVCVSAYEAYIHLWLGCTPIYGNGDVKNQLATPLPFFGCIEYCDIDIESIDNTIGKIIDLEFNPYSWHKTVLPY